VRWRRHFTPAPSFTDSARGSPRMVSPVEGTPFGRYHLVELLGRGGMGEVWRAHDTDTDRIVAIKLLLAHFSDNEEFQRRFRREAHAASRLNTPHVIPIHNYGEIDGRLYVDMRLIEGRDLETVLAGERGAHAARPIVSPNTSSTSRSIKRRCLRWAASCRTTRRRPFLPRYGFRTRPW
jgi:serine/threonine protein kinase